MPADHTKAGFASPYASYANIGVYSATIAVGTAAIGPGNSTVYSTTIEVEDPGHYATVMVQTNDSDGNLPATPTALRWTVYPPSYIIFIALTTDPYSAGAIDARFGMSIDGNEVTFTVTIHNPYDMNIATAATTIGVQYAIHSLRT